jgi:hypothetical protein
MRALKLEVTPGEEIAVELHGSITEKEKTFVETWENVSESTNYIVRENRRGDEVPEGLQGKRKFKLTTYERILTEDKIKDARLNPFKNGAFRPVLVPDDVSIETNPNALSEEDILRLFGASDNAWDANMDVLDSPETLKRMIDLAESSDSLSLKRYRELEGKYEEHSKVGKRLLSSPKYQDDIDKLGPMGQGTGPVPGDTAPKTARRRTAAQ